MFKRTNINKLNNRTSGLSPGNDDEETTYLEKQTSLDINLSYHSDSKRSISNVDKIEEEPPKKKDKDSSFISYRSDKDKAKDPQTNKQDTSYISNKSKKDEPIQPNETKILSSNTPVSKNKETTVTSVKKEIVYQSADKSHPNPQDTKTPQKTDNTKTPQKTENTPKTAQQQKTPQVQENLSKTPKPIEKTPVEKKEAEKTPLNKDKTPVSKENPGKTPVKPQETPGKTPVKPQENTKENPSKTPQKTPSAVENPIKTPINAKTPAENPSKTPQLANLKSEPKSMTKEVSVKKEVVVFESDAVKKSSTPVKKTETEKKSGVVSNISNPVKKVPTAIIKKEQSKAITDSKWKELNSKILCIEPHNPWECDRDFIDEKFKEVKKNKGKFTDDIFIPSISSLANNPKQVKALYQDFNQWIRATDIYKGQTHTISHSIDPNDIKQGELGNCYFLSALSSLAERPDRILRLFEDQVINDQAVYYVRMCVDGIWRYILIDDFVPCALNLKPVFAQPRAEEGIVEFWVLFLEKAWAKTFGSYENIDAGFPEDVFFAFTGAPSFKVETEDPDAWKRLEEAEKRNFIMTAACGQDDIKTEAFEKLGLVPDHAYSLISVKNITHPKEGKVKLCEIRNPWGWGSEEWDGKWSDGWAGWKDIPQIKKEIGAGSDDGRFFMCYEDFMKYFDYVTVCKMDDEYYFVSYPIRTQSTSYSIRTFTLQKPGNFFLTLTQKDERYFRGSPSINYHYSVARVILAKKDSDETYEFIDGISEELKNLTLSAEDMEAGDYVAVVVIDTPDDKKVYDYVLSYYGSQNINMDRIRYKDGSNILEKIMSNGGKGQMLYSEKKGSVEYNCYLCLEEGLIVESYLNNSSKEIVINKDYSKCDKKKYLLLKEDQNPKFKLSVPEGETVSLCSKILNIFDAFNEKTKIELKSFGYKYE